MFNAEQREWAIDERRTSLTSILIALLNTYAGLATAIAGFVLDNTALVVVGMILVGSAAVLVNGMAKALNRQEGELCESSHPSRTPLTPSVKNSASLSGSPDRTNAFADTTGDHQWIHVDVERAGSESRRHNIATVS
jgi:hypothetical protein